MELKVQILTVALLLIGCLHLYPCQRCRPENKPALQYDCSNLSLTDLPSLNHSLLFELDLSHNDITTLKNDAFLNRDLVDIYFLNLQDNKITTIEVHAFRGIHTLDFLYLNNNDIVDVPTDLFKSNKKLRILRFGNNTRLKLPQEGFNLPVLFHLDLERCGLEMIPPNFFDNMPDLELIYLRGNRLSYVDPEMIKPLDELRWLDLQENMFTKLQVDILRIPLFFQLSFSENPLDCDCALLRAYSLYKKKSGFTDLSCITANGILETDLDKLAIQLDCSPTTETPNQNGGPNLENDEPHDLDAPQVNTSYKLRA